GCGRPRRLPLRTGVGEGIGGDSVGGVSLWAAVGEGVGGDSVGGVPLWVAVGEGGGRSGGIGFLLTEAREVEVSRISGNPFWEPMTTTFALSDLESSNVASIPFHLRKFSEIPGVTIAWKSRIPPASMRFLWASFSAWMSI